MKFRLPVFSCVLAVAMGLMAQNKSMVVVNIKGVERVPVSVETAGSGPAAAAFNASLKRNLAISGHFELRANGAVIRITGTPGGLVAASGVGRDKMTVKTNRAFADAKAARMAAREFVDAIVNVQTGAKGFACERIVFADRKGKDNGELYTCYPDGYDIRQLTSDRHAVVGPRWAPNKEDIYYTGFLQKTPLVYRISASSGRRELLASFKGLATGAAVAPDGRRCAIILSFQGNPELYVYDMAAKMINRMTRTPRASEASPCWNRTGTKMVYVSDETRQPQIYMLDVASRKSTRLTRAGSQNTNPDWGPDGRIVYASKRGGQNVLVVMDPAKGEASARVVTAPGAWEHPSWAADGRHVVAECNGAIFIVDTDPEVVAAKERPIQLFRNAGHWMNPSWCR
jgi:TolB protein